MKIVFSVFIATAVAVTGAEPLKVEVLDEGIVRVRMARDGRWPESGMNRYGVLADLPVRSTSADLSTLPVVPQVGQVGKGFELRFPLRPDTRIFGLGDVCRTNVVNRRGSRYEMWVKNVTGYIPVPVAFTTEGWGCLSTRPGVIFSTSARPIPIPCSFPRRKAKSISISSGPTDFGVS